MTRLAIVSDIHGNHVAFEAVVEHIATQNIDEVIVAGDLVGRGPQGSRVIEHVKRLGWETIRGNHEDYILGFLRREVPENWWHEDVWAASRWMAAEASAHEDYIDSLPLNTVRPGLHILHGSPRSINEGIGKWTSIEDRRAFVEAVEEPILVCAHTHRTMNMDVDGRKIVNVGSVGMPFNGNWKAQYAIFDDEGDRWEVTFPEVEYDREVFYDIYDSSGFLKEGKITARLLKMEVEAARPFLVPFLRWIGASGLEPVQSNLETFLRDYNPEDPLRLKARPAGM